MLKTLAAASERPGKVRNVCKFVFLVLQTNLLIDKKEVIDTGGGGALSRNSFINNHKFKDLLASGKGEGVSGITTT
jgi:hypothetical protein